MKFEETKDSPLNTIADVEGCVIQQLEHALPPKGRGTKTVILNVYRPIGDGYFNDEPESMEFKRDGFHITTGKAGERKTVYSRKRFLVRNGLLIEGRTTA